MRKLVLVALFVAACGNDSDGGSSTRPLTGTVGGRSFSALAERVVAARTGTTPCTLPAPGGGGDLSFGISALAIELTSYADACGDFATGQCVVHPDAQSVTILFAKLDPTGAEPQLAPGTFTVYPSPATAIPDGTGRLTVAYAQALATGAAPACAGTPSPAVQGGTLRLDDVSGSPVKGHVDLTFADGSTLEGDFSAALCEGTSPDICEIATAGELCTPPATCVP
jgi:hypothetical protein